MGFRVTWNGNNETEYASASSVSVSTGHLYVTDDDGNSLGVYAPGCWTEVTKMGQSDVVR